jgi:hypothetical protein
MLTYHSVENILYFAIQKYKDGDIQNYILPVVLYGCETWSLTRREEHWLRVFENRVMKKIFGHKRDGVTGDWRRLHKEELCDMYSPNIIRLIKS